MKKYFFQIFIFVAFITIPLLSFGQEEEEPGGYGDLLFQEVEVENPVYYPVVSVGTGMFDYFGEFNNDIEGVSKLPIKINAYSFLDSKHNFRINLYGMKGYLNGSLHELKNVEEYNGIANFETEIFTIGLNLEYGFGHFYKNVPKLRPFIAPGVGMLIFNPRSDIAGESGEYNWQDQIVSRDYDYNLNMQSANVFDLISHGQNAIAATVDIGFDLALSSRVFVRVANGFHYAFTDVLDGIPYKNGDGEVVGNSQNDILSFSYFTIGWDPFSESATKMQELLFADVSGDFDYAAIADEDRDDVLDLVDECPDNPPKVAVDSVGCPLDDDNDGVPNYKDKEVNSSPGAIVNDDGVEMTEDEVIASLNYNYNAVTRDDAYMIPVSRGWKASKYANMEGDVEIPEKFKPIDKDGDGEIAYRELLQAIDAFFNGESDFTANDIYELNDFFFAQ